MVRVLIAPIIGNVSNSVLTNIRFQPFSLLENHGSSWQKRRLYGHETFLGNHFPWVSIMIIGNKAYQYVYINIYKHIKLYRKILLICQIYVYIYTYIYYIWYRSSTMTLWCHPSPINALHFPPVSKAHGITIPIDHGEDHHWATYRDPGRSLERSAGWMGRNNMCGCGKGLSCCHTVDGQKSCTSWEVVYPIIYKVPYIPGGCLGFLSSTG